MTKSDHGFRHGFGKAANGDHVVRSPRTTDAIGQALRGVFVASSLPTDLALLVTRLDRATRH